MMEENDASREKKIAAIMGIVEEMAEGELREFYDYLQCLDISKQEEKAVTR